MRVLVSETKYKKKECPRCGGRGTYTQRGADGEDFGGHKCNHVVREYIETEVTRMITYTRGWRVIKVNITDSKMKKLKSFLADNDIEFGLL